MDKVWARIWAWLSLAGARSRKAAVRAGDQEGDPALRALAAELKEALAQVAPRASYRGELRRELAAVARQRRAPRIVMQRPRNYRRGLLIGAAALSSAVSVAGLVAFIWHQRVHRASQASS